MPDRFLHGHIEFKRAHFDRRESLIRLAREGQSPLALYIGCSDSRVVPELLTGASPGELFVVRNVAAYVPPKEHVDSSVGAAIEYALGPLDVRHLVVCGHTGCGGVKAALEGSAKLPADMTELRDWLDGVAANVAPVSTLSLEGDALLTCAVEENVLASLGHLLSYPVVARKLEAGTLQLHGWVYDMHSVALRVYDPERDAFVAVEDVLA
jgi:carbonic anhydrase